MSGNKINKLPRRRTKKGIPNIYTFSKFKHIFSSSPTEELCCKSVLEQVTHNQIVSLCVSCVIANKGFIKNNKNVCEETFPPLSLYQATGSLVCPSQEKSPSAESKNGKYSF